MRMTNCLPIRIRYQVFIVVVTFGNCQIDNEIIYGYGELIFFIRISKKNENRFYVINE